MDNENTIDKSWEEILDSNISRKDGAWLYDIPSAVLIKKEKSSLKDLKKFIILCWVILGILIFVDKGIDTNTNTIWLLFLSVTLLIVYIILRIRFRITAKKKILSAAERITIDNMYIQIANDSYLIADIKRIYLTKPRQYIYNYYIYVQLENKKKKYWLGTEESNVHYESLCKFVMKNLSGYPSLVKYKNL